MAEARDSRPADSGSRVVGSGTSPPGRPLATRLLARLILLYRRRISGRGVFGRLRCSFEGSESCSRYGQRVTDEGCSALVAARLIAARLRRCSGARVYRFGDGGLGGEPLLEDVTAAIDFEAARGGVLRELMEARELAGSCAVVGAAIDALARDRGLRVRVPEGAPWRFVLRSGEGAQRGARRRLCALSAAALGLALAAAASASLVLAFGAGLASAGAISSWRRGRRLGRLAELATFSARPLGGRLQQRGEAFAAGAPE